MTFIDDHLRKVWATAQNTKDRVLDAFKELHIRVEKRDRKEAKNSQGRQLWITTAVVVSDATVARITLEDH